MQSTHIRTSDFISVTGNSDFLRNVLFWAITQCVVVILTPHTGQQSKTTEFSSTLWGSRTSGFLFYRFFFMLIALNNTRKAKVLSKRLNTYTKRLINALLCITCMFAWHIYAPIYVSNKFRQPKMHQHVVYYIQDMVCSSLVQIQ